MRKKIMIYMETDTDENDVFIEQDIKQELGCCSCFYENIYVKIWNIDIESMENTKNDNSI